MVNEMHPGFTMLAPGEGAVGVTGNPWA